MPNLMFNQSGEDKGESKVSDNFHRPIAHPQLIEVI